MQYSTLFLACAVLLLGTAAAATTTHTAHTHTHTTTKSTSTDAKSDNVLFVIPRECWAALTQLQLRPECVARTASNALSLGLVLFSLYYKVPQITKMVRERSAKSISPASVLMEVFAGLCAIAYYYYLDYDFMAYGEVVSGAVQSLIILSLCYAYREMGGSTALAYAGLVASGVVAVYLKLLPMRVVDTLLLASSFAYCLSRLLMVVSVVRARSSGSLSFLTLFFSLAGMLVRVFTTVVSLSEDRFLLLIMCVNTLFSATLFGAAIVYRPAEKRKAN